jgi:hypothetical protein
MNAKHACGSTKLFYILFGTLVIIGGIIVHEIILGMAPKGVLILISGICGYVTFHGKRSFADVF